MIASLIQDIRYALRQLRKSPGFALTAVAVLALGLGANTAVFTLLDGILLRPLPYAQPNRIALIGAAGEDRYSGLMYADMRQLMDAAGTGVRFGAFLNGSDASVVGPLGRFQVQQTMVTAATFEMLGVQPILGRSFRNDENDPGRSQVVLLSEEVWRTVYGSDLHVVGKTITLRSRAFTIIGVMSKGVSFPFGNAMQIWSPAVLDAAARSSLSSPHPVYGNLYARVPDGMTSAQLADLLSRAQSQIAREIPDSNLPVKIDVTSYQDSLNHDARKPLALLYAVVFGIWALACLNVTSLMLARAVARTREYAIRSALGASRARLMQQSIVESLLLSGFGSLLGLLAGQAALKLMWRQIEHSLPLTRAVYLEWRVIAGMVVLTLLTAVLVGVFPALRAMRRDVQGSLHGVNSTASASHARTREVLVVAQVALTLVFLVGAGLFLRTVQALRQVPLGFAQQNVLTGGVILNGISSQAEGQPGTQVNMVQAYYLPLIERLRAIPGVKVAALSSVLPMRSEFSVRFGVEIDHKKLPPAQRPTVEGRLASAGLVEALGIPMIRGRFFTEEDTATSPVVVVVNQAFANRYLPGEDAIGHTLSMGKGRFEEMRIVGVIGDVKQTDVTQATSPEMYVCLAQVGPGTPLYGIASAFIQVAIRSVVPADALRTKFDKALHEVAPDATTTDVETIHEAVEDSFGSQTLISYLLETFACLALLIASVGLYGLLSFTVGQRTREIGLRLALGAQKGDILSLVLRRALLLAGAGLVCGTAMAWFAVSLARSYIFGVQAHDALTFGIVVAVLAAASFLAAWMPARHAASIEPVVALRSE